jgi:hypothetical protein
MKILYIPPVIKIKERGFKNKLKCFLYDNYIVLKNFFYFKKSTKNTSGYIDSALHSNAYTFELPYNYCLFFSKILNIIFDGIFINWKFTNLRNDPNLELKLIKLSQNFKIKKIIVDTRDTGNNIIESDILNKFDHVIKREKNISITNKKYLTTMLPCSLIDYKISKKKEEINWNKIGKSKPNNKYKYDVFFSGSQTSKDRINLIEFLKNKNFNFYGILENKRIPYKEFLDTIYNSSINLAPAGIGEFTFRHLEILSNCSFMMCEKSINQIELPIPLKDGDHFITYEDKEDLLEKINYYLINKELRLRIALNGRKVLEEYYSPKKHGETILKNIFC